MTAIFAQPTTDENLTPGWSVQGSGAAGSPGPGALGYGSTPANTTTSMGAGQNQQAAGVPAPPGASNANPSENSAAYGLSVLTNPGYADATGPATRQLPANPTTVTIGSENLTTPAFGTTGTNPSKNLAALVSAIAPTPTSVSIKNQAGVVVSTTLNGAGPYTVPPGGSITINATATAWTWSV